VEWLFVDWKRHHGVDVCLAFAQKLAGTALRDKFCFLRGHGEWECVLDGLEEVLLGGCLDKVYPWNAGALCQSITHGVPFRVDGYEVLTATAGDDGRFQSLVGVCMCEGFGDVLMLKFGGFGRESVVFALLIAEAHVKMCPSEAAGSEFFAGVCSFLFDL